MHKLPKEMQNLKELVCLILTETWVLEDIPSECFSGLRKLQELHVKNSAFQWTWGDNNGKSKQATFWDIKKLAEDGVLYETDIPFKVDEETVMRKIADSRSLLLCVRCLTEMENLADLSLVHIKEHFHLQVEEPFPEKIAWLYVGDSSGTLNLEWVEYFPGLQVFRVLRCKNLTTLLSSSKERHSKSSGKQKVLRLTTLEISGCPKLNCITKEPLQFPNLETVEIKNCPELKRVPFSPPNAPKLRGITWDGLEILEWLVGEEDVEQLENMLSSLGLSDEHLGNHSVPQWLVFLRKFEQKTNLLEEKVRGLLALKEEKVRINELVNQASRAKTWFEKVDSFVEFTSRVFNIMSPEMGHSGGEICLPCCTWNSFYRDHEEELYSFLIGVAVQVRSLKEEGMDLTIILDIEPLELQFPFELGKQISRSLQLSNNTDKHVAFKTTTTNQNKYMVQPNMEMMMPHSTLEVVVTTEAQEQVPEDLLEGEDEIIIESTVAKEGTSSSISSEMFTEESRNVLEKCKVSVAYDLQSVLPSQPEDVLLFSLLSSLEDMQFMGQLRFLPEILGITSSNQVEIDLEQFEGRVRQYLSTVLLYEDASRQLKARESVLVDELQETALSTLQDKGIFNPSKEERDQAFLEQLVYWFHKSFKWVSNPPCDKCGRGTQPQGIGIPTPEEERFDVGQVEIYECKTCNEITRFPRYNDPAKLVETRRGRSGEWANCFTLYCRAFGFDARLVFDYTDNFWTECFSPLYGRWVHCDACNRHLDFPLVYEQLWGKNFTYVLAFSKDGAYDVTKRYSRKLDEVLKRRDIPEDDASYVLSKITSECRRHYSPEAISILENRDSKESEELNQTLRLSGDHGASSSS